MTNIRVQKIISESTTYSRRKAEDLIKAGRVKVNKQVITIGAVADPNKDKIYVDEKLIKPIKKKYFVMNKPSGHVTSTFDPHEKTIMKLLPKEYKDFNLFPAGRLDKDTEGLLILTNDGDFANKIMHPSNNVKKTYDGICLGTLSKNDLNSLRKGIKLEEGVAKCEIKVEFLKEETKFEMKLITGWSRQIRRMFDALNHKVIRLRRIKIGELELINLGNNLLVEYTKKELEDLIFGK